MPHTRPRSPSSMPDVNWDVGLKEMNETWKGAVACIGVAIFFIMTIGIIYWQVMDQPNKNWILKGTVGGLIWERNTHTLILQTLSENKTYVEIDVGNFPDMEQNFVKNLCWLNKTDFCYTWDSITDLKITLDRKFSAGTECYNITWTPIHCDVKLKDCFSMTNVSWYGGASLSAQHWPMNNVKVALQPLVISNLKSSHGAYGSVLERYFLGSTEVKHELKAVSNECPAGCYRWGVCPCTVWEEWDTNELLTSSACNTTRCVSVLINPNVPISMTIEKNKYFCVETPASTERFPLQYTICIGQNIQTVHQEIGNQLYNSQRMLPNLNIVRMPLWKHYGVSDSAAKLERDVRSFHNKLRRHGLGDCLISLNEHSTTLLSMKDHILIADQGGQTRRHRRDPYTIKNLNISITSSLYQSVNSELLQKYLKEGQDNYWLSLRSHLDGSMTPILTKWKEQFSVRLNITSEAAINWYFTNVNKLIKKLGAEYLIIEGAEGNTFMEHAIQAPKELEGDSYSEYLAATAVEKLGNSAIITASTRSNHLPLFVQMHPLRSDWSYHGLKGIIPSVLHYSLLGYNFFIPDAVGGTLADEFITEEELFIRWLQIITFLPVMSFNTPPWVCCDNWVLNLTRQYIQKHQDLVAPILLKCSEDWMNTGIPIFRPVWWLSPEDPVAFTVDNEFLIGDEMLIAPITEKGKIQRDIFLPGKDYQWMDKSTSQVFDGGTVLRNYNCSLHEIPVFIKKTS